MGALGLEVASVPKGKGKYPTLELFEQQGSLQRASCRTCLMTLRNMEGISGSKEFQACRRLKTFLHEVLRNVGDDLGVGIVR